MMVQSAFHAVLDTRIESSNASRQHKEGHASRMRGKKDHLVMHLAMLCRRHRARRRKVL